MTNSKPFLEEVLLYFDPIKSNEIEDENYDSNCGSLIKKNLEEDSLSPATKVEVALFCIDSPFTGEKKSKYCSHQVRVELYRLKGLLPHLNIVDLGNLRTGANLTDALFALQEVCSILNKNNVLSVILGGNQLYTIGSFLGLKEFETDINLTLIDSKPDLSNLDDKPTEDNFLTYLLEKENGSLYNISLIGYQKYLSEKKQINQLNDKYFESYRLGTTRENLQDVEIILRDSDIVSFDLTAIRGSDAPAQKNIHPNGFYTEEACAIARYAGLSDRITNFGLYGYIQSLDNRNLTAKLAAEITWHFLDGYQNRKHDFPVKSITNYKKIVVPIDEIDIPVVFYVNELSDRWWLEVSNHSENKDRNSIIISSSEADYKMVCNNELPERWWINFKKLS